MASVGLQRLGNVLGLLLLGGGSWTPAQAHPHVWISVETTVLHERGTFVGFRHKWSFDELYTAMAIQGLDKDGDGKYDRGELTELAQVNIEALKDLSYFTFPLLAGQQLKIGDARDYWMEHNDGILSLHFTVPLAQPVLVEAIGLTFSVYDPTYFIAFALPKTDPVRLAVGAPNGCRVQVGAPAQEGDPKPLSEALQQQFGAFAVTSSTTVSIGCSDP